MNGTRIGWFLLSVFLIAGTLGCNNDPEGTDMSGKLLVQIANEEPLTSRTIENPSLIIEEYEITGTGPEGIVHATQRFSEHEITIVDLEPGEWEFHITGFDKDDYRIAEDVESITIKPGDVSQWDALLIPLHGEGDMILDINLPDSFDDDLHISTCLLKPFCDGDPIILDCVDGTAHEKDIPAGYYRLVVSVSGKETQVWSNIYSVRILADQEIEYNLDILEEDMNLTSTLEIQVDSMLYNPLEVDVQIDPQEIQENEQLLVSADLNSPLQEGLSLHYGWYSNGELSFESDSENYTFVFYDEGVFHITVLVHAVDPATGEVVQAGYDGASVTVQAE